MLVKDKGFIRKKSSELKVSDIVQINPNERIPADMILLYTQLISKTFYDFN